MQFQFDTRLKGKIVLTGDLHARSEWLRDKSLYKFLWVRTGRVALEIDHVETTLIRGEVIALTPFHHIEFKAIEGEYAALMFNSNFYCIFGHDSEVSCNGFLFNGGSRLIRLALADHETAALEELAGGFAREYEVRDNLREEMLRILLKRFIILCTRMARERFGITADRENGFDVVRQYMVLVDNHFREKKQVKEYADMLNRSPKTLANLFSAYRLPSPLHIIHERIETEAKRLLLYSSRSAKEIAALLGFEDLAAFSRFFKNVAGESITSYRTREKGKN
ncbi:MAG: helix-turn-helix domain-containing protein [Rikenellaceae bacterium]|nr:helix-turn-helix domain-containing protein [Rikenellaceae bacterium]MCC8063321.1 helix-turn-helix domain-containing protein [Rikenellaceae bacterium]